MSPGSCKLNSHALTPRHNRRTIAASALLTVLACFGSAHVLANPIPPWVVLTHVHENDGADFCASLSVSTCDEIVQATDQTGRLAFDFIARPSVDGMSLEVIYSDCVNFSFAAEWPEDWGFVQAQACGSGTIEVTQQANRVIFSVESLRGAPEGEGLVGMGRVVLDVVSEGSVRRPSGGTWIGATPGRAGTACSDCVPITCEVPPAPHVYPLPSPAILELTASQEGTAVDSFHVDSRGFDPDCEEYGFESSAPWLVLEIGEPVVSPWGPVYDVGVLADGGGLEEGTYEGWIEIRAPRCQECVKVVFDVPAGSSPVPAVTWSAMKARFR